MLVPAMGSHMNQPSHNFTLPTDVHKARYTLPRGKSDSKRALREGSKVNKAHCTSNRRLFGLVLARVYGG